MQFRLTVCCAALLVAHALLLQPIVGQSTASAETHATTELLRKHANNGTAFPGVSLDCQRALVKDTVLAPCLYLDVISSDAPCSAEADSAPGHFCSQDSVESALKLLDAQCSLEKGQRNSTTVQDVYARWYIYGLHRAFSCSRNAAGQRCINSPVPPPSSPGSGHQQNGTATSTTCDECMRTKLQLLRDWIPPRPSPPNNTLVHLYTQPPESITKLCTADASGSQHQGSVESSSSRTAFPLASYLSLSALCLLLLGSSWLSLV